MFKNIYDTPVEVEVSFSVADTSIYRLPQGRMFTTHEIWTGTGKTGTQLVSGTDYVAAGESSFASTIKGESVYTGFQITNAGYHSTTLYATIYFVGTAGSIETKNMKAVETITATTYTIDDFGIDVYEVNNGECTITLPDRERWQGREITVRAITDATTGISIETAGSDVITRADLTDVSLTSDGDFWVFFAGSTRWELVDGVESYETATEALTKTADGWGDFSVEKTGTTGTAVGNSFGTTAGLVYYGTVVFDFPFTPAVTPTDKNFQTSLNGGGSRAIYIDSIGPSSITVLVFENTNGATIQPSVRMRLRWYD